MAFNLEHQHQIDQLFQQLSNANETSIGYPLSKDFDYSNLYGFLKFSINNVGDPYEKSTLKLQTHHFEKEVIDFFAKLLRANMNDYWGYVTNGGSESNLYGLYIARELYPKGIVYYSESTHYSVQKNVNLLNIPSILIRSKKNGEIDYVDLEKTLQFNRNKPAIILTNFGTTMTEAKDDVSKIKHILKKLAFRDYHIHCDAALCGAYGSFINPRIPFDLEDGADSIAVSGHKFIGSPMPSGVVITKRSLRDRIAKRISYIGSLDTTITGSRNGHSVLFLWYAIKNMGMEGFQKRYQHSLEVSNYCQRKLVDLGIDAWKNSGSITVVIPKVSNKLKLKWQLATEEDVSHIICMPNVTKTKIDAFIKDIKKDEVLIKKEPNHLLTAYAAI